MDKVGVAIIGVGWIGDIRASNCANSPYVEPLVVVDIVAERARQVAEKYRAAAWYTDYKEAIKRSDIHAVIVSTTPEETHYPIALDVLRSGKHLLLEKPMGLNLQECDELIKEAERQRVKFTIGYTQRFNTRFAYAKQSIKNGLLGEIVSALATRNVSRTIGHKISSRVKLTPAVMEAIHDIDYLLWVTESEPTKVYAQSAYKLFKDKYGVPDEMWILINTKDGAVFSVGAGWILPPGYPHYSSAFIEIIGTEGAITLDDTHRDVLLRTSEATLFPLSTMPGEQVLNVFHGPMEKETLHFIDCIIHDREPLVKLEEARAAHEVAFAADLAAERNAPVELPLR